MTEKEKEETIKRLKARLECDKRQVKGIAEICNPPYMCEECDLCYAQGMLGERNIDLTRAIEVLSVKAIPIETIKKEIERLKEDIKWAWYYGNTAIDKMEYLKMWLEIKIEDWENENEKSN